VDGSSLDCSWDGVLGKSGVDIANGIVNIGQDTGSQRKFQVTGVSDSDGVGSTGGGDNGTERTHVSVFNVDTHLLRGVIGSLPQVNIGIQRTSVSLEENLDTLHSRGSHGPGSEGSTLYGDRGELFPDVSGELTIPGSGASSGAKSSWTFTGSVVLGTSSGGNLVSGQVSKVGVKAGSDSLGHRGLEGTGS